MYITCRVQFCMFTSHEESRDRNHNGYGDASNDHRRTAALSSVARVNGLVPALGINHLLESILKPNLSRLLTS